MSRKFSVLVAFCVVLFGAILAGYWDMLDSERLRSVRDQASASVAELTGNNANDGTPGPGAAALAPSASPPPGGTGTSPAIAGGSTAGADASPSRQAALTPAAPSAGTPQPYAPPQATVPSFDVLRVEPDGSAVLAGRAPPNADVRLLDGQKTIGAARATPEGDFAIVLDQRLAAGDHQIRIEALEAGKPASVSEETAIVSVPRKGQPGELLAMVETPDKPSRIITLPSAAGTVASALPGALATGAEKGARPEAPAGGTEAAALPAPGQSAAAANPAAAAPAPFAVEAVEIENGTVYIAGRAPGTAPVRVYIDDKLLGEDAKRANGRFLVTRKIPLGVGDHRIRADMVGPGGAVASRVEVPFARPEGEAMSAIASNGAGDDAPAAVSGSASADATSTPAGERPAVQPNVASTAGASAAPNGSAPTSAGVADAGQAVAPAVPSAGQQTAAIPANGDAAAQGAPEASVPLARGDAPAGAQPPSAASPAAPATASAGEGEVATIRQPALEGVNTRVLIRRGDTLWRISRDTYGAGHRYTVIYVANGDQIRNPNRIYPGQVFRLPKGEAGDGQGTPTAVR